MIKFKSFLVIILLLVSQQNRDVWAAGAGVLVSTVYNDQVHILVADHKKPSQVSRGWSSLGGTVKEGETELQAAVREVVEESNGVLSRELLLSVINPRVKTVTPGFTIFYAQIPYQKVELFNQTSIDTGQVDNTERGPFIWIPWQEILSAAKEYREKQNSQSPLKVNIDKKFLNQNSQTDWFFNAFLATIEKISKTPHTQLH